MKNKTIMIWEKTNALLNKISRDNIAQLYNHMCVFVILRLLLLTSLN